MIPVAFVCFSFISIQFATGDISYKLYAAFLAFGGLLRFRSELALLESSIHTLLSDQRSFLILEQYLNLSDE